MDSVRPSILRRPVRDTKCTQETQDEQHRKEQERIAARGRRQQEHEARLMHTLYPTPEVMQQRHRELQHVQLEQLAARAAERQRQEQQLSCFTTSRPATAPTLMPWAGASLAYRSVFEERSARKQFEAQLAEDNRRMALDKALQRQQQRQAEAAAERERLTQGFWNVCATSASPRYQAAWGPSTQQQQQQTAAGTLQQPLQPAYCSRSMPVSPTAPAAPSSGALAGKAAAVQTPWALHSATEGAAGSLGSGYASLGTAAAAPRATKFPWEWPEA